MFRHGVRAAVSHGLKTFTLGALVTGALLVGAAPASAHDDDGWRGRRERQWDDHDGWRRHEWREHHRRWREPGVVVYEAPPPAVIYRAPPTVVYRQPPVVYAPPPPPVVYAPGGASLGIGVNIPFR